MHKLLTVTCYTLPELTEEED